VTTRFTGTNREGGAMSSSHHTDWRELATRERDGLEISLLWSKSADRVKVVVVDQRLGESFDIDVERAHALTAFEHPFAYATSPQAAARFAERRPHTLPQQA
jgi:hypothetical protein